MAGSSWSGFAKTILIPMLIALSLYAGISLIILPLHRRYRSQIARYSNYTPLSSSLTQRTTSLFEPYLIEPSKTLMQKARDGLIKVLRWVLIPGSWQRDMRSAHGRSGTSNDGTGRQSPDEDDEEEDSGLFDVESGEAMVGFDSQERERGRTMQRSVGDNEEPEVDNSNRRLNRDLEEGFRDDSGSEASDEEVTAGRRSVSRRRQDVWT